MASLKDYGGIDRQTIDHEKQRMEEDRAPSMFLGLDDGETGIFRILPARPGQGSLFHTFWKHTYTDPVTQKFVGFACPRRNPPGDLACPVCDQANALLARGRSSRIDNDLGYALSAKKRVLVNVYLYEVQKKDGTSQVRNENLVWEFSSGNKGKSMHEELIDIAENVRAGGDFVHPLTGFPFMLARTGSQKHDTTYKLTPLQNERGPIVQGGEDEILAVLERMLELNDMCAPPDAENLRALTNTAPPQRGSVTAARPAATGRAQLPPARGPAPPAPARAPASSGARAGRTAADYMATPPTSTRRVEPAPVVEVLPVGADQDDWGTGSDDEEIPF